jgi:hypothetical protein
MYKYAYYKKMSLKERLVYGADSHFYQYVSHILELRVTRVHEPLHNPRKMAIETMNVLLTAFHATSNLIDRKSSLSF